jgi:hypothetical protein
MVQLEYDPQGLPEITVEVLGVVSSKVQGDLERFKVLIEKRWRPAGREQSSISLSARHTDFDKVWRGFDTARS